MQPLHESVWDRWDEVDRLLAEALERPARERERYVARACGDDPQLFREVMALVEAAASSEGLSIPGGALLDAALTDPPCERAASALRTGQEVGHYRVVEEIGHGGMATVYLAERADGAFEQQVAVKVVRKGLDTDDVVRRFLAERRILSGLMHPHIARLLDGGATEDGRPYLVMERVEGDPITTWADDHRLPVRKRLDLFLQVADAVQFAHNHLVIHRDLKPSNVLVDAQGRVKLLDFGIAKLLAGGDDGEQSLTRGSAQPLTPEYASPEQLRGERVTTASDVFQLGVQLYVLLTGHRPFARWGTAVVDFGEPMRPSEVVTHKGTGRAMWEDLDTIVLKALREEPGRRYASALEMAEDVRRYLEGRPISARRDSRLYRLRKFLGRHRWLAPVAAAAALALGLYIATLVWQAQQLEIERNAAQRQAERAERVRDVLVDVFRSADPWASDGSQSDAAMTVPQALSVGVERVRGELAQEPELQADLYTAVGGVYVNLGFPAEARPLLEDALQTQRELHGPGSGPAGAVMRQLGKALMGQKEYDSAAVLLRTSLAVARRIHGPADTVTIGTQVDLAWVEMGAGRLSEAERLLLEAIRLTESGDDPPSRVLARAYVTLAVLYPRSDRQDDARAAAEHAVELLRGDRFENDPGAADALQALAGTRDADAAIPVYRAALEIYRRSLGADHPQTLEARESLALSLNRIAHWENRIGPAEEAERILRETLARRIALFGNESLNVALSRQRLAVVLYGKREFEEAEQLAVQSYGAFAARTPQLSAARFPLTTRCGIQLARRDFAGAESTCREAYRIARDALPKGDSGTALMECRIGRALAGQGRLPEAATFLQRAGSVLETVPARLAWEYTRECLEAAASVAEALGRTEEAARWRRPLKDIPTSVSFLGTR